MKYTFTIFISILLLLQFGFFNAECQSLNNINQKTELSAVNNQSGTSSLPFLPDNFQIRFDVRRLHNLSAKEENRDNTYYFPDTVVVYSISENPKRYTYLYSAEGFRQMTFVKTLQNEEWQNQTFIIVTNDTVGNPLVTETRIWGGTSWVNDSRKVNEFSTNHNILRTVELAWNGSAWDSVVKDSFTYNVSGKPVAYLREVWQENQWSNEFYDLYTYDANDRLISAMRQVWEINTWINDLKYTYSYDENDNMITALIEQWNVDDWVNFYEEQYVYDALNQPIEYTGMIWLNEDWMNFEKMLYTYNDFGYVTEALSQFWVEGAWANAEVASFTLNYFGGIQSEMRQIWVDGGWVNSLLTTFEQDDYANSLSGNLFHWDGSSWAYNQDGIIDLSYYYNLYYETYVGYLVEASYLAILTGIDHPENNNRISSKLYPNPAGASVTLSLELATASRIEVSVLNLTGMEIQSVCNTWVESGEKTLGIDTGKLSSGIYQIRVTDGVQSSYHKLIISH